MFRRLAILIVVITSAIAARAEAPFSFASTPGKLPKDIVPTDYRVHLVPDLATLTFQGRATIRIEVRNPTRTIVLNTLNLEISSAVLNGKGLNRQMLTPVHDKPQELLRFELAAPLARGRYEFTLAYSGLINRNPQGLFYDKYTTATGPKTLIATEMEPTDARRLFPCWDEPAFRARFTLSADLPAHFSAYSNMPVAHQEKLANGLQRVQFQATPRMSSYLVVLAAGEFERIAGTQGGVEIGIVTTAGKRASAAYALATSQRVLHYYNDYFGTRYPLPKLDQVAMPGGFGGAMENWGGILYNETALLYDEQKSPESTKRNVHSVVAHEIAHQWFGDLVTMAWWDNLWLNEGFASWMSSKATHHFNPQWHVWLRAGESREAAMNLDSYRNTHPVQSPVENESQANNAFDDITYQKGQAFLRMLEAYLGEQAFRNGIRDYVAKHKYSNTTTADLWAALGKASGRPVAKIAGDWTTQPGFPVIKVDAVCRGGQRHITLEQEQFKVDDKDPGPRLWQVPIQLSVIDGRRARDGKAPDYVLLDQRRATVVRPGCEGTLLVDPEGVGFYRVQYAPALLEALTIRLAQLPDNARLKLLADAWSLVRVDRLPVSGYLSMLSRLENEPRLAIWDSALKPLSGMDALLEDNPLRPALHQFAVKFIRPRFNQLGWNEISGESVEDRELRAHLAGMLAAFDDEDVVREGQARFKSFLGNPAGLPPSLANVVTQIAGRRADQATYEALYHLAQKATSTEEKQRYYSAMASARDPALAKQTMTMALSPDLSQVVASRLVQAVAANDHRQLAWTFARDNSEALLKPLDSLGRNNYFPGVIDGTASTALADEMEAFVKQTLDADAFTVAKRIGDIVRVRAEFKSRLLAPLAAYLGKGQ